MVLKFSLTALQVTSGYFNYCLQFVDLVKLCDILAAIRRRYKSKLVCKSK